MNPTVTSNGVAIPRTPQYFAAMRESDRAASPAALRAQYAEDGYMLLRGVLPAKDVIAIREAYLRCFDELPKPLPPHGVKGHPAYEFVRTATFRAFVERPVFHELAERLTGSAVAPIRRTPLRHFVPGKQIASRAHIDGTYIDGAPTEVLTIWTPLGDCALDSGSLMYLEGSHQDAALADRVRPGAPMDRTSDVRPITHDLKWLGDLTGKRWLTADFAAGDVVVHSPSIIHATLDAVSGVRVSADIRFQRKDTPRDPRWDRDWSADDGY